MGHFFQQSRLTARKLSAPKERLSRMRSMISWQNCQSSSTSGLKFHQPPSWRAKLRAPCAHSRRGPQLALGVLMLLLLALHKATPLRVERVTLTRRLWKTWFGLPKRRFRLLNVTISYFHHRCTFESTNECPSEFQCIVAWNDASEFPTWSDASNSPLTWKGDELKHPHAANRLHKLTLIASGSITTY